MMGTEIAFGPGKADLLESIAKTGSISEAARGMDMSYMRAWQLVQTMNRCFGEPLIAMERGGSRHGGATLTKTGQAILKLYRRMEDKTKKAVEPDWVEISKLLVSGAGE